MRICGGYSSGWKAETVRVTPHDLVLAAQRSHQMVSASFSLFSSKMNLVRKTASASLRLLYSLNLLFVKRLPFWTFHIEHKILLISGGPSSLPRRQKKDNRLKNVPIPLKKFLQTFLFTFILPLEFLKEPGT